MSSEAQENKVTLVDVDESLEFLNQLRSGGPWHLVSIVPDGPVASKTFHSDNIQALTKALSENSGKKNIYVHVNPLKPGFVNKKAKKEDVAAAEYVHVDVDDANAIERVKAFKLPPTAAIFSGGGLNLYFRLDVPLEDLGVAEDINRWLVEALGGDRAAVDVSRILRMPGTMNLPNKRKLERGRKPVLAKVLHELTDWSRSYRPEDFGRVSAQAVSAVQKAKSVQKKEPDAKSDVTPRDIPPELDVRLAQVALTGDDPERPRTGEDPRYPSRSEAAWAVACGLARLGWEEVDIAGVLLNPALAVSASILDKRNPSAEALRQAKKAVLAAGEIWPDGVQPKTGVPNRGFQNTQTACLRLGIGCRFDVFRNKMTVSGQILNSRIGELADSITLFVRDLIGKEFGFDPGNEMTHDAIVNLGRMDSFDPVLDYLDALVWDGVARLDSFLSSYAGAPDNEYVREVSAKTLIAAVRRVRHPGKKFDTILVLEGPQGSGKSTLISTLAGSDFFSDQDILALDSKAQMEVMDGVWLYEICELAGMRYTDVNKIKAFASRTVDKARPAYGRSVEARKRRCIFIGTTNEDQYLKDETGNRRFWCVLTGRIDLAAVKRDRDQLWAEAAAREAKGESIVLSEALWDVAAAEQQKRVPSDPWTDTLSTVRGQVFAGREQVATQFLITDVLPIRTIENTNVVAKRIARVMNKLGWHGPKLLTFREGNKAKGYWRATKEEDTQEIPI